MTGLCVTGVAQALPRVVVGRPRSEAPSGPRLVSSPVVEPVIVVEDTRPEGRRQRRPADAEERRLARRLRRGDPDVLGDLYARYGASSYGLLLRMLRNRDAADDVQQLVYAEVWRRGSQYDAERAGLLTWILTIARSRAVDHLRRRVPEPVPADELTRIIGGGHDRPETDLVLDRWQAAELLAALPPDERELLQLRFYAELSQTEIAARLGLPLGTVKARMVRALRRMRTDLEGTAEAR
jgi:RNA polymerase sigma-70 factor (ECF subfamily)